MAPRNISFFNAYARAILLAAHRSHPALAAMDYEEITGERRGAAMPVAHAFARQTALWLLDEGLVRGEANADGVAVGLSAKGLSALGADCDPKIWRGDWREALAAGASPDLIDRYMSRFLEAFARETARPEPMENDEA